MSAARDTLGGDGEARGVITIGRNASTVCTGHGPVRGHRQRASAYAIEKLTDINASTTCSGHGPVRGHRQRACASGAGINPLSSGHGPVRGHRQRGSGSLAFMGGPNASTACSGHGPVRGHRQRACALAAGSNAVSCARDRSCGNGQACAGSRVADINATRSGPGHGAGRGHRQRACAIVAGINAVSCARDRTGVTVGKTCSVCAAKIKCVPGRGHNTESVICNDH